MKLRQILNEMKQVGTLYHYTDIISFLSILSMNKMIIKPSGRPYISFTRNKNFHKTQRYGLSGNFDVQMIVDGNKLSNKYKIDPYQYHFYDYDKLDKSETDESEEIVKSSIANIKNYIIGFKLFFDKEEFDRRFNQQRGFEQNLLRFVPDPTYENVMGYIDSKLN